MREYNSTQYAIKIYTSFTVIEMHSLDVYMANGNVKSNATPRNDYA